MSLLIAPGPAIQLGTAVTKFVKNLVSPESNTQAPANNNVNDTASLSTSAQSQNKANPYEGFASQAKQVTVAQGDNLSTILSGMGYSGKEMYGENGVIAKVMSANPELKNANLIRPGQSLNLPVKGEGGEAAASSSTDAAATGAAAATGEAASASATTDAAPSNSTGAPEPIELRGPLHTLENSELKDVALSAREHADHHLNNISDTISGWDPEARKSVGQAMFYETAATAGLVQVSDLDQPKRNATSAEVREYVAKMKPEERAQFEEMVQGWASEPANRIASQNAMAAGAGDWVFQNFDPNAPEDVQQQYLTVAKSANGVMDNNTLAVDASYQIYQRDPEMGEKVFAQVN